MQEGSREWDSAQEKIQHTGENGYCDKAQRVIWVFDRSKLTLIHEMCHAVTKLNHGKRFRARLRQTSQQAERLGETALAQALSQEADMYEPEEGEWIPVTSIYEMVEALVSEAPGLTFEQIVEGVAADLKFTPTELHRRARRLRRVYEKAQKDWEREQRRKERNR